MTLKATATLRQAALEAGMTKTAEKAGLSRTYLYAALSAQGNPRLDTLERIAAALGYQLQFAPAPPAEVVCQYDSSLPS